MSALTDDRTPEDLELAQALMGEDDPERFAAQLFDYYHDNDRADRTPRSTMYLHLGMAAGLIMRMVSEGRR